MPPKDLLSIRDWSSDELCGLLSHAAEIKRTPRRYERALEGESLRLAYIGDGRFDQAENRLHAQQAVMLRLMQ